MSAYDDVAQGRATPDPPQRPEQTPSPAEGDVYTCDVCGAPMREWMCRIVCQNCGYQRDCEDP